MTYSDLNRNISDDCPRWCVGDHAEDTNVDHFHDGPVQRLDLGDREVDAHLTCATTDGEDDTVVGLVVDGDYLPAEAVGQLVELLAQAR